MHCYTKFMRYLAIFILTVSLCYFVTAKVSAQTMSSNNYQIRLGNFNMTSGFKSSASYNLTDTVGQTAASFFSSTGYHVKAGFQYIYTLYNFSFSLSSLAINLTLLPDTFSSSSHTLTVSAPGQGYGVTAYEVNKLTLSGGSSTIPDTTCDSGTCTETSADVWTTPTNNGFGYNVTGNDVASDFISSSYFRPLPDASLGESPATIMTTSAAGKNRTATVTYRVSPSGSQDAGTYSTQIVYIATPVY